jgi:hypothetical protein
LMVVFIAKSPISASALDSSSRPISSKLPTSERAVLSSDWYDEWKEDDLDDFEEVRSGGEPGIGECTPASWKFIIASSKTDDDAGDVSVRCRVAILAVGVVLGMKVTGMFQRARDRTTPERSVRVCVCVGWIAVAKAARQSK